MSHRFIMMQRKKLMWAGSFGMAALLHWNIRQVSLFYASYYPELVYIYGETSDINSIYAHITDALAAYQQSEEVNSFSSKYDAWMQGKAIFTEAELHGMNLFGNKEFTSSDCW